MAPNIGAGKVSKATNRAKRCQMRVFKCHKSDIKSVKSKDLAKSDIVLYDFIVRYGFERRKKDLEEEISKG